MSWKVLLVAVIAIAMGFFQERLKIDINFRLQYAPMIHGYDAMTSSQRAEALLSSVPKVPYDYYYSHETISWFDHFTIGKLGLVKWVVAVVLLVVFWALNIWLLTWGNVPYKYRVLVTVGYIIISLVALLIYCVGSWANLGESAYLVSRRMLGLIQSPLPGFVLYLAHRLYFKQKPGDGETQTPA